MKLITLFALLIISISLHAQSFSINIEAETSVNGNQYLIDIQKTPASINIVYQMRDSICNPCLQEDKDYNIKSEAFLSAFRKYPRNQDSVNAAMKALKEVIYRNSIYKRDTLRLKIRAYPAYAKLLDSIQFATDSVLENKAVSSKLIILDGTMFTFTITSNGAIRNVYAHSPTPLSHPLLYNLLHNTLAIYREQKPGRHLTARNTSGY